MDTEQAIELLKKYAPSEEIFENVYNHSHRVMQYGVDLAKSAKGVDVDFVATACLLHDIGRFYCPPGSGRGILHGIEGARILREENLTEHAEVAERHIGVGITREDIMEQGLSLPMKDYTPRTKEEMIVAYADNLDSREVSSERDVEERFCRELGERYREKVRRFHEQVHELLDKAREASGSSS